MSGTFLHALKKDLPPEAVLTDPQECAAYATDWTKLPGAPAGVVLPRSVSEVSRFLSLCDSHSVSVVPSGGRTGLAGGAVATRGEWVLNLSRMNQMHEVNTLARTVRVGAGSVTEMVHRHCEDSGLTWPIDLASKGSCQIGGNLSTNAGGLNVIRYGMARKWVSGLQVVTAKGDILELNSGLEKNNTGYDLMQLVLGSEGTLAVITEATLKLVPIPNTTDRKVFLFSVENLEVLPLLFERFRRSTLEILAFEFFSDRCLQAVKTKLGRVSTLSRSGRFYALCDAVGEIKDSFLEDLVNCPGVDEGILASASSERKAIWGLREGITESLALTAPLRKHDLCVPILSMAGFLGEVETAANSGDYLLDVYFFGHFGDGSPHVNLLKPASLSLEAFERECERFETFLFTTLQRYHGSISSEHGIGLLKKKWLSYSRSEEQIRCFKAIKSAWDPKGILNPGKVFD